MIQIFSNTLGSEEIAAMKRVIDSKWLGMGPECKALEAELSTHFGTPNVLLINNCTAGIYLSLKALGVKAGDEVIVSTANFIAIPSAISELGATPVFADVDPDTFNILPQEIDRLKTKKTKAVYLLHYGGHPAPFDEIKAICQNKIRIAEDSANAIMSTYKGKSCGTLGDAGVFSFDAMKTLVMGDGGALILQHPDAFEKAKVLRYLGFAPNTTSGVNALKKGNDRWWEYDIEQPSGRFISNDILASVGRIQLKKLPGFIKRRKQIWDRYQVELANVNGLVTPPEPLTGATSSYYLYWLRIPDKRDQLAKYLNEKGIYTTFRYFPLHMVNHFKSPHKLANAEHMNEIALNIPLHQNLTDDEVTHVISSIRDFFPRG